MRWRRYLHGSRTRTYLSLADGWIAFLVVLPIISRSHLSKHRRGSQVLLLPPGRSLIATICHLFFEEHFAPRSLAIQPFGLLRTS